MNDLIFDCPGGDAICGGEHKDGVHEPASSTGGDLERVTSEIRACRLCRDLPEDRRLPQEPRPIFRLSATARLFICSQAPGMRAHSSGIPFNDPSGVRLRAWMGVTADEFYDASKINIVPMGFCFPGYDRAGGDRPPRLECAPTWRTRVFAALPRPPELILMVGSYAQRWHLGKAFKPTLTETLKDWRTIFDAAATTALLPLPHPSWRNNGWLKRNPWFETEILPVLKAKVRGLLAE